MKTLKVLTAILIALSFHQTLIANDGKYIAFMQKNIQTLYSAASIDEYQHAVNGFERVAGAEKNKWEPYYYAAFGYIMMANVEKHGDKKDAYLDMAMHAIDKTKSIVSAESEVVALEGFASMIRVTVDPATRGPQYAPAATQLFQKAVSLNPENPRALVLMAQMQYGTSQFFGSPATEACSTLRKALEKFTTYKSDNPLAPAWGLTMAKGLEEKCR